MFSPVCMQKRGLCYVLVLLIYPATQWTALKHVDEAFLVDAVSTQTVISPPRHLAFSRSATS